MLLLVVLLWLLLLALPVLAVAYAVGTLLVATGPRRALRLRHGSTTGPVSVSGSISSNPTRVGVPVYTSPSTTPSRCCSRGTHPNPGTPVGHSVYATSWASIRRPAACCSIR